MVRVDRLLRVLSEFGFDPVRCFRALRSLPRYVGDLTRFRRHYRGVLKINPCLHDRSDEAGETRSEYFWQDLIVAQWLDKAQPEKHVDVGSRIDGFVAHIASFRDLEVFDIRAMRVAIPRVRFRQVDVMSTENIASLINECPEAGGYCDSLSCLHVLEHFGLGRYGDALDADGYCHGFRNLVALLKPLGTLYLSTPVGQQRVEFNAHRVFAPGTILDLAAINGLRLKHFLAINQDGEMWEREPHNISADLDLLAKTPYTLVVFTFEKCPAINCTNALGR